MKKFICQMLTAVLFALPGAALAYNNADLATAQSGLSCPGGDLSGADLSGMDLSGKDFTGTDFTEARLDGTNLNNAQLAQANFHLSLIHI